MKKIYLLLVLFGAFLLCACEKENIDPLVEDQTQLEESALKGANKNSIKEADIPPFPMWARMAAGAELVIPTNDEYGIIVFYVNKPLEQSNIPQNHNFWPGKTMADWFAWNMELIPTDDWAVEGSSWYHPPNLSVPHHYKMNGKGNVLIWIITRTQVQELYNSENITIQRIWDCTPLVGHATTYKEILRPYGGGAPVLGGTFHAHGWLEGGGTFVYNAHTKVIPGESLTAHHKLNIKGRD